MAIIVFILVIPLVGLAILLLDAQRQRALPFVHRPYWTTMLKCVGAVSIAMGIEFVGTSLLEFHRTSIYAGLMWLPPLGGLGMVAILTGVQTFRLPQSWPMEDEDGNSSEVIDRYTPLSLYLEPKSSRMRTGAWVMMVYPLTYVLPILGILGALFIAVAAMALSSVIQTRRAFQTQLLWLITIAVRNQLPLADEFRSLSKSKGVRLSRMLQLAAQDLDHGDTLSMAMERHQLLPASTYSAIRASEGGSHFVETLRRLAAQSSGRLKTYSLPGLSEVFIQVLALLSAWSLVVGFVMYFIMPKIRQIFHNFDTALPPATQLLIDASENVYRASAVTIFWVGIGMSLLMWQAFRHLVGWSSLPFPALMHWFPKRDAPEVLRALAGIAGEKAALSQKIPLLTNRRGRPDLGARYQRIAESLDAGETLSYSLYSQGLVTSLQRDAVAAAERGGQLEFMLFSLADAMDQREFRRSTYWAELLKPAAIIVCGAVTALVVIAVFLPLVKLLNDLS